ncbi:MAG TPA: HEAT repeat domain-containing protein [Sedimentisphaerales bacterium]|nr:HEAT repeat domain-containing protein [Sedimentisphaerales bacterium]
MRISAKALAALLLVWLCMNSAVGGATGTVIKKSEIDKKLAAIVNYERGMSREPLIAVEKLIRESQNQPEQRKYIELQLAELLSEATLECKSFICRQLWFIGTADSVPAIAKLLMDEETADIACYAIGQNPSEEAGKALREALDKVSLKVQIRIINLLGDRRDTQSVEAIGKLVFVAEREVGEAAVAALGKIGGIQARKILVEARAKGDSELRFAATDAYLRCAEDLVAEGKSKQATIIYKELADKDEAAIIRSAAIRGLADAGGQETVPLVIAALRDENRMVRTTARSCVRTMKGQGVTELFAGELPKTPPDEQVLLIGALADRGDTAALPAITKAAESANTEVRKAVLQAVGKLGDASSVGYLVKAATEGVSSEEKSTAINSLKLLRGSGADNAMVKSMQHSQPSVRSQLIQVLFERNAVGAVPALLGEAVNPDREVRKAAFKALGRLGREEDLPSLVKLLVKLEDDGSHREAERAVVMVSRKISETSKQADAVLAELHGEKRVAVRCSLLRVLGGIANNNALRTLEDASKETNPAVRDTAVRTLAKWPNATAAEVLLEIYSSTQNQIHRLLSLRGFVRLLALSSEEPFGYAQGKLVEKTLKMCRQAMNQAHGPAEQKLMLSGLANVSDPGALSMVEPFLQVETVRAEAAMATIKIAGAIIETHPDRAKMAINKLLAVSKDEDLRRQAEEIVRKSKEPEAKTHP